MGETSDAQLLDRFTETGEISHFNELVTRHIGKVRAIIYPMVLNNTDTDDLTQEVFLKVLDSLAKFQQKAQFTTWLYRIAMNAAKDFLRKNKRNPVDYPGDLPDEMDSAVCPAGAMMAREFDFDVGKALAALSPSLRSAIVLTAIQGMNVQEAAQMENCLTATMYWRLHKARKILESRLAGHLV